MSSRESLTILRCDIGRVLLCRGFAATQSEVVTSGAGDPGVCECHGSAVAEAG